MGRLLLGGIHSGFENITLGRKEPKEEGCLTHVSGAARKTLTSLSLSRGGVRLGGGPRSGRMPQDLHKFSGRDVPGSQVGLVVHYCESLTATFSIALSIDSSHVHFWKGGAFLYSAVLSSFTELLKEDFSHWAVSWSLQIPPGSWWGPHLGGMEISPLLEYSGNLSCSCSWEGHRAGVRFLCSPHFSPGGDTSLLTIGSGCISFCT